MSECLCVFFYICPQLCSKLGETPITPALLFPAGFVPCSRQCEEEMWLILGWSLFSHPSHFPTFLPLYQFSVFVPGFLALTGWLKSHSGTIAPRPKQGLMSKDTLFSPFPFPDGKPPCVWSCLFYLSLEILIGRLQLRIVSTLRSYKGTFGTSLVVFFFYSLRTHLRFPFHL